MSKISLFLAPSKKRVNLKSTKKEKKVKKNWLEPTKTRENLQNLAFDGCEKKVFEASAAKCGGWIPGGIGGQKKLVWVLFAVYAFCDLRSSPMSSATTIGGWGWFATLAHFVVAEEWGGIFLEFVGLGLLFNHRFG